MRLKIAESMLVCSLILLLLIPSIVWIGLDQHVWPWDQAWYGEVTIDVWRARHLGMETWLQAMLHAIGAKPPLMTWAGQFFIPLSHLTGDIESALLLLNICLAAGTLWCVYFAARQLGARVLPSLAGVLCCWG